MKASAIVLAAGEGSRMKSKRPKVVHEILGKPLVRWVVDAVHDAGISKVVCVLGHAREQVLPLVEADTTVVFQERRLGTGDAVRVCQSMCAQDEGSIVVLTGDSPLISPETIQRLVYTRESEDAAVVLLTMKLDNPFGYGRIIRSEQGEVERIVEQKDCTSEQAALNECNSGFYCFDAKILFWALEQITNNNAQKEYYLTDVLEICRNAGHKVMALTTDDPTECSGVNSRIQLAQASKAAQQRINQRHMSAGVSMLDPDLVWIGPDVEIGQDVELLPMTMLMGSTKLGDNCVVGPNSRVFDTQVGNDCVLDETIAYEAQVDAGASCGPRAYLRPGTHLCEGAKAGTHVEIKKSTVGAGSKVPHLSYIGDATLGENVNVGAGTITCNYDGTNKHKTTIGDDVFIGSDTMLVAPVNIGSRALIGAGSVITKDVSEGALAIGRARQSEREGWADRRKKMQDSER